jgi:hypothetical protein
MRHQVMAGVSAFVAVLGLAHPAAASPASTSGGCGTWTVVPAKSPTSSNYLYSVSGISATADVWAVGQVTPLSVRTLTEHWNGRTWRAVSSVSPGDWSSLNAVWALSPHDVWAVGAYDGYRSGFNTLAEHWDGHAWSQAEMPTYSGADNWLNGLAFSGPEDGWAVGKIDYTDGYTASLTIRWDGASWTTIPSPNVRLINAFKAVDALSASDAWAVGYTRETDVIVFHPLAEHWDGAAWTITEVPEPVEGGGTLESVVAVAPDDVWAISGAASILHWDGTSWSIVDSPSGNMSRLFDVAAAAADDVWAVGSTINREGHTIPLVEHWDGVAWTVAPTPPVLGTLYGVETFAGGHVWAVGASSGRALSLHFKEC